MSPGGGPLLLSHPACALHHAPGHPERPERLEAIDSPHPLGVSTLSMILTPSFVRSQLPGK